MQFVLRGKGLRVPDDYSRVVEHRMVAEGGLVSRGTDRSLSICAEKPLPKLPYDITTNVVWLDIQTALIIIRDVATGRRIMAMIISLPGFGKSFLANREMRKANCAFHLSNPQDANALVSVLWQIESGALRNSKGELIAVLLLDDADACARRETPANVVKGAFGEARRVIWESQAAFRNAAWLDKANPRYNPDRHSPLIPPMEFNVSVRLLWLSNADFTDEAVLGGTPEHFRALVSRGLDPFRIRDDAENDGYAVFLYTHHAATEGGFLKAARADGGYPYEIARQAVDFYVHNVHRLIDIVPRRLKQIATVFDYYRDQREREPRLQAMLRPTDQRPRTQIARKLGARAVVVRSSAHTPGARRTSRAAIGIVGRTNHTIRTRTTTHRSASRCTQCHRCQCWFRGTRRAQVPGALWHPVDDSTPSCSSGSGGAIYGGGTDWQR